MNVILVACLISLAVVSAQPAASSSSGPNKECFQNRPKVRPSECCTGASLIADSALATCKAKYPDMAPPTDGADKKKLKDGFKGGKHPRGPGGNPCLVECYLNQTAVYKNGALDKTKAVTVLGASMDANMKKTLATAIDSCLVIQETIKDKFKNGPKRGGDKYSKKQNGKDQKKGMPPMPQCGRTANFLIRCVESELFKNCPAAKKVASEDCSALTTYMDKCKFEK